MSDDQPLLVEKQDGICTLRINRPHRRNAFTPLLFAQMAERMRLLSRDRDTRVVIIRGAGTQAFSSGDDVETLPTSDAGLADWTRLVSGAQASIEECPIPTIAMVFGYCLGAGFALATLCDLRIAASNARIGLTAAKMGVVCPPDTILTLVNLVGFGGAKEVLLTGRTFNADKAGRLGWANEVVPDGDLEGFVHGLARELADNSSLSMGGMKAIISKLAKRQVTTAAEIAGLATLYQASMAGEDHAEAKRAFAEKRKPRFVGRVMPE